MPYKNKSHQRLSAQRHYDQNKARIKRRAKNHTRNEAERIRAYVAGYLSRHPCVDCDEQDPVVLEFDHRDASAKSFSIADALQKGVSLQTVVAEVEKCDVRCANCHRRKTARERIANAPPREKGDPPAQFSLFKE